MPARPVASPEALQLALARGPAGASALAAALRISVPTVHRLLARSAPNIVQAGLARRTRYGLTRPVRGANAAFALHRVDAQGRLSQAGRLTTVRPEGSLCDLGATGWPVTDDLRDGWWDGLPYPLHQMRPQGYMGRQFALAESRSLGVPPNPAAWADDDTLVALGRRGVDLSGDLLIGDEACERWLAVQAAPPEPALAKALGAYYVRSAEQAVAAGVAGSSAGGEFPKFTARRTLAGSATPHVLVKFSGRDDSAAVRRWSDLLVCEHLAGLHAASLPGVAAARSRIVQHGGRTFLEVERFDRHGEAGRSAFCALEHVDAALLGSGGSEWPGPVERLATLGLVDEAALAGVQRIWWFGRLVANTDMHGGNLGFRTEAGRLALAPVYDMVPMAYAPLGGGEVPVRRFAPVLPLPAQRAAWLDACAAAIAFWRAAALDSRIGEGFRAIADVNAGALERLRDDA